MADNEKDEVFVALGAIGEVLTKQNQVLGMLLAKAEADEEEEEEAEEKREEEMEKAALVKSITDQVMKAIDERLSKADEAKQGITAKQVDVKLPASEAQKVIQAAVVTKAVPDEADEKAKAAAAADAEKKGKKDEEEYPEVEKLRKQISEMQVANEALIKKQVEERLQKAGWVEEKNTAAVRRVAIGADIQKSEVSADDKIGQLSQLSYAQLKKMEMQAEVNELPDELRKFIS